MATFLNLPSLLITLIVAVAVNWALGSLVLDGYLKDLLNIVKEERELYFQYYKIQRLWYCIAGILTLTIGIFISKESYPEFAGILTILCWIGWASCTWIRLYDKKLKPLDHTWEFLLSALSMTILSAFLTVTTIEKVLEILWG